MARRHNQKEPAESLKLDYQKLPDKEAAHQYRLQQAAKLIESVETKCDRCGHVRRAYELASDADPPEYKSTACPKCGD